MIPFGVMFAESIDGSHDLAPKTISQIPSSIIHIVWFFMSFLLVASFCALLRASLIKSELPGILRTYDDVFKAQRPIMIAIWNRDEMEYYKRAETSIGKYLAENAVKVFSWSE